MALLEEEARDELGVGGIRDYAESLQQYLHDEDERHAALQSARRTTDSADDHETHGKAGRPEVIQLRPANLPEGADMAITPEEAAYLLERWRACHPHSLPNASGSTSVRTDFREPSAS